MATFKRVMVTPVVCPRLLEILTTLTFGAQRGNHSVSTAFETIAKKTTTETRKVRCQRRFKKTISIFFKKLKKMITDLFISKDIKSASVKSATPSSNEAAGTIKGWSFCCTNENSAKNSRATLWNHVRFIGVYSSS